MLNFDEATQDEALEEIITQQIRKLDGLDGGTEQYTNTANNIVKLLKIKNETTKTESEILNESLKISIEEAKTATDAEKLQFEREKFEFEKDKDRSWRPSPDAVVAAAGSILGILAILHHEKLGVVTSKALSFVGKGLK